jgi:hypothetical protein
VVVDTGVSTYEQEPDRFYERSTAAHNTLRIDGEEQAEIWGSFRVGRRPRVGKIRGGTAGAFSFVGGEHAAYRRLGVVHARKILFQAPDTWVITDQLKGAGCHRVESFLHFHPSVRVDAQAEPCDVGTGLPFRRWAVNFGGETYGLVIYGGGEVDLLVSTYSEQFGKRHPSTVLRRTWQGTIPAGVIHIFAPAAVPTPHIVANWSAEWIEIGSQRIALRSGEEIAR